MFPPGEQSEVEAYSRISSLLGVLKSKARRVLKRRGANGKTKRYSSPHRTALDELVWRRAASCCEYFRAIVPRMAIPGAAG